MSSPFTNKEPCTLWVSFWLEVRQLGYVFLPGLWAFKNTYVFINCSVERLWDQVIWAKGAWPSSFLEICPHGQKAWWIHEIKKFLRHFMTSLPLHNHKVNVLCVFLKHKNSQGSWLKKRSYAPQVMRGAYPSSIMHLIIRTILTPQHDTRCMGGVISFSNYVTLFMKIYYIISFYHNKTTKMSIRKEELKTQVNFHI